MALTIYSIGVLIDEMKSKDFRLRYKSMDKLSDIAQTLGAERTRRELIPFLTENTDHDDNEVLLRMIEQLKLFIPYVGGVEHASVLLPPLENLCIAREASIRDKAVKALCKIGRKMNEPDLIESFIPMLERLAAGVWFTGRISSCGLFHTAYPHAPEPVKNELRTLYRQLCDDETPSVRMAAAKNLEKFAETIEELHLMNYIMPMTKHLLQNDHDSVRSLAVKSCIALRKLLEPSVFKTEFLRIMLRSVQDTAWRVRGMVADQFLQLCDALGPDLTRDGGLFQVYICLVEDNVVEVRTTGAGKVTKFCQRVSPETTVQYILPHVKALSLDSSHHVRTALSSDIVGLAPIIGKVSWPVWLLELHEKPVSAYALTCFGKSNLFLVNHFAKRNLLSLYSLLQDATVQHLLPIFHSLLKDSSSEVRWNIISKLDQIYQVIGIELICRTVLLNILELTEVRHSWWIRHAIIEFIPIMASHVGPSIYNDVVGALCIQWLADKVCAVREAAVQNLKRLAEIFGREWASENIIPQVLNMVNDQYYLYRMNALDALLKLAPVMGSEITCSQFLPVILAASKDSVPNCRSYVAKVLKPLASVVDQSAVEESIRPCLNELRADIDREVVDCANEALQAIAQVNGRRGQGS
ncbi:Serine/threonine-protein phosphatase 2A 65 kDa regulatory subunit A beta isoform [Capsicum chinense]|nr:Serine/threonine-protein phosphatase 2A 65 kDa regulatory subunit A beta isoform [Capsicum chinense]